MNTWKKLVGAALALAIAGGAGAAVASVTDNPPSATPPARDVRLLGNGITEAKFTPIVPCRILDTREAVAGKVQVGAARIIDVRGDQATFVQQGGNPGGCGIPTGATAIEATITAVDSGSGFLRAWPANLVQPNATFLNFDDAFNVSNTGTITICGYSGQACVANQDLNLRAYGSATHLVVDVAGYYVPPMSANVAANGTLGRSSRTVSATRSAAGVYRVIFDRRVKECTYYAGTATEDAGSSQGFVTVTNLGSNVNGVFVETYNATGTLTDRGFQVQVVC